MMASTFSRSSIVSNMQLRCSFRVAGSTSSVCMGRPLTTRSLPPTSTSFIFKAPVTIGARQLRISRQAWRPHEIANNGGMPIREYKTIAPLRAPTSASLSLTEKQRESSVAQYIPPQTGLLAYIPKSWVPYAELLRLDKPTGTYYLFFPCVFSTLLAAPMATPITAPMDIITTVALFSGGALIMRGAGCAINDLWDRNLDPKVERTKFRPIARGALTPQVAILFTGTQLLAGLGILLQFPMQCLWYGIPSLLLVSTYPLAKRVTDYPQFVLGLTFSWGAIMGFPALGVDLLSNPNALQAAAALYASCISWTVLYDMIYAHMDIKDDLAAGIKSIALRHEHNTKTVLSGLAVAQVSLLAAAGMAAGAGPLYFLGACGSAVLTLGVMITRVQLKDVKNCWWWFKNGCWFTGGGITLGLLSDYVARLLGFYDEETETHSETAQNQ